MRAPIVVSEPFDARRAGALGCDAFSDPTRRAAMIGAFATGEPQARGPVQPVEAGEVQQTAADYFAPRAPGGGGAPGLTRISGFAPSGKNGPDQ
ncbi:MAG: CHASE domain-containing protein [Alphaproteobacteria bacterium]|nr:CHASE domain-containing protein [Alphaproteobacteria bacterium]